MTPPRAFAIVAHPDDIEFGMAGTMFLLVDHGWEVHYMNVGTGSCGSTEHDAETIAAIRIEESKQAAAHLNATFHPPLAPDLEIFYERSLLMRLSSIVRRVAPDILLLPALDDYMEDHMNVARLGVTAAFSRGMPNFPVDPPEPPISKPVTIYHAQPHGNHDRINRIVEPDIFIDITEVVEEKAAMLSEHASQKSFLEASQGMNAYIDTMRKFSRFVGKLSGQCEFAEGWRRHNPLGFCAPDADPLVKTLREYAYCPRR